jgi:heme-degrading monooxygenase HmoA
VSAYTGPADRADDAVRAFEAASDTLRKLNGFERGYMLIDRETGNALTMTLWASEEAEQASAEAVKQMRAQAADSAGASIESVVRYEVAVEVTPYD